MQALIVQLQHDIKQYEIDSFKTVYIGGGTPSTIKPALFEEFFAVVAPYLSKETEITIEANPNSATFEWLKAMRDFGANRISFGVQSFDDRKLAFLGRAHRAEDAIKAVENAQKAGFEHINIDLIYETVFDDESFLKKEVDQALQLPIDHISAYALILEENTPFAKKNEYKSKDDTQGYLLKELIPFEQYEVSNFGHYKSRHNLGYWKLEPYLGVGAGAVGFIGNRRYYPTTDLKAYIANPLKRSHEKLDQNDLRLEKIFLGLRSIVGVEKNLVDATKAQILIDEGKLELKGDRLYNKNYFLADEIALFLS